MDSSIGRTESKDAARTAASSETCSDTEKNQAASLLHFLMWLLRAAPLSFFSSADAAQAAEASFWHFLTKLFLAAPDSFCSLAWIEQDPWSAWAEAAKTHNAAAISKFFKAVSPGGVELPALEKEAGTLETRPLRQSTPCDLTPPNGRGNKRVDESRQALRQSNEL
jgi:hypothetical protein